MSVAPEMADGFVDIGPVADFPEGQLKVVTFMGRDVVIIHWASAFYALANRCPHRSAPLARGHLGGHLESVEPGQCVLNNARPILGCSWHGWEFDVASGQALNDDQTRARTYQVRVAEDRLLLSSG